MRRCRGARAASVANDGSGRERKARVEIGGICATLGRDVGRGRRRRREAGTRHDGALDVPTAHRTRAGLWKHWTASLRSRRRANGRREGARSVEEAIVQEHATLRLREAFPVVGCSQLTNRPRALAHSFNPKDLRPFAPPRPPRMRGAERISCARQAGALQPRLCVMGRILRTEPSTGALRHTRVQTSSAAAFENSTCPPLRRQSFHGPTLSAPAPKAGAGGAQPVPPLVSRFLAWCGRSHGPCKRGNCKMRHAAFPAYRAVLRRHYRRTTCAIKPRVDTSRPPQHSHTTALLDASPRP